MITLCHPQHRGLNQFHFGESRMVNFLGLGVAASALKGAVGGVKGGVEKAAEKAGVLKRGLDWMTHADSALGYIAKSPFILTRKAVELTVGGYQAINGTALMVGAKVGDVVRKPVVDAYTLVKEVGEQTAKTAFGVTVIPAAEIAKSTCLDFPNRALVDQFRTGLKTIFGTVGTLANDTLTAAKETVLSPLTFVGGVRDAVKEILWEAPKAIFKGDLRGAGKHFINGPTALAKGILKAPAAIASIPYHAGMKLGLGGLETAVNGSRAMVAPIEGMVNAYRAIGNASNNMLDYLKTKLAINTSNTFREQFKSIFSGIRSPVAATA